MTNEDVATEAEILLAIPFDHLLYAEATILGATEPFALGSYDARVEVPRDTDDDGRGLHYPVSATDDMKRLLPEKHWGIRDESATEITLEAVLIVVKLKARIAFELSEGPIGGDDVRQLVDEVNRWFNSFTHWLWVLTAQSLDPLNPDPKVLHRRSNNSVVLGRASGKASRPTVLSPPLSIRVDNDGPASERLVDAAVLRAAVCSAGVRPSMMRELLASARMAARRGDRRRALVDAGTSAEAALTEILQLPATHGKTLGGLVTKATRAGVKVPLDTQTALVGPRNDAVHRGSPTAGVSIDRALEITEELVSMADGAAIRVGGLTPFNRPQRHDLMFVVSNPAESSDND